LVGVLQTVSPQLAARAHKQNKIKVVKKQPRSAKRELTPTGARLQRVLT